MDSDHDKAVRAELEMDLSVIGSIETSRFGKKSKKGQKHPLEELIKMKEDQMKEAVKSLDFETAAILRDELKILRNRLVTTD
jgi:protein-arginine kinase activator protein McsA